MNQLGVAYVTATSSALVAALGCKSYWQKHASPFMQVNEFIFFFYVKNSIKYILLQRYVPFAAVAAANCINIPLMRQQELINGVEVVDEKGNIIGNSRVAAVKGISQVQKIIFAKLHVAYNHIVDRLYFPELLWLLRACYCYRL